MPQKIARKHYFSPSEHHQPLMCRAQPKLRFDGSDTRNWKRRLRHALRGHLGVPRDEPCDLRARRVWITQHALGTIEKVVFRSQRHADVPAYVCLPAHVKPPYPFMICLQGHTTGMHVSIGVHRDNEHKSMPVQGDRDFAIGCMRRGLAAICIEQRAFGERAERKQASICSHNGCHDAAMHALMLGHTLAGERVHDVERTLDYLASRGDADMRRVGCMGNSGGGTIAIYAAALLSRLAFAMPSCSFCTYRDSIMSIYHCACNFVPGLYQVADAADILGLFAPKPLVIVAGQHDGIFPIGGVRKAFRELKAIYAAANAADRCRLVVGPEGHRFYADAGWDALLQLI